MTIRLIVLLFFSSLLASFGQVLLKLGADHAASLQAFLNLRIFCGLFFYCLSTALWIYALSFADLNVVYAFTALTFALVYCFSLFFLKEKLNFHGMTGVFLVLAGLYLIALKGR